MDETVDKFKVAGAGETFVSPLGLTMLLVCGFALIALPRRFALWPLFALVCLVTTRQCIAIGGINLYFVRIMVLVFGLFRIVVRGEYRRLVLNKLDFIIICFGVCQVLAGAVNWNFDLAVLKERAGYFTEQAGLYLLMRILITNCTDARTAILGISLLAIPILCFFCVEYETGRNLFSVFGGVAETTQLREGRLRCEGAFPSPIVAGTFWVTLLPFILFLSFSLPSRFLRSLNWLAVAATLVIVILTASSTPIVGLVVVFCGMAAFRFRRFSKPAFAVLFLALIMLHLIMKAPVWSLIERISITGGDSGYHRYLLVDGFITHFDEWWFLGTRVGTQHWGHYTFDLANAFVAVGVNSGVFVLGLFFLTITLALFASGRVSSANPLLGWAIGVSIVTNCVCFLGISVWGQLQTSWMLTLSLVGSLGFVRGKTRLQKRSRMDPPRRTFAERKIEYKGPAVSQR